MLKSKNLYLTTILSIIIFQSCGIYSFSGASIPEEAKSIYISSFKNESNLAPANISNNLMEILISKCQNETNLITSTSNESDLNFYGKITKYEIQPISIQNNEIAAQNRLTIQVEVQYINNLDAAENFKKNFTDYADFNSDQNITEIEDELNTLIITNLVDDIFNNAFMKW